MTMMLRTLIYISYLFLLLTSSPIMQYRTNSSSSSESMSFVSYNSKGFSENRQRFLLEMIDDYDIILLQEHWLCDDQLGKLHSLHDSYSCHAVSGVDCSSDIISGRPFGGCAIFWKKSIKHNISIIKPNSRRFIAISMTYHDTIILIINVYMPCDARQNVDEYETILSDISNVILEYKASFVILGGDFNCDLDRTSPITCILKDFLCNESFINVNDSCSNDIDYTYINHFTGSTSNIDHFFVTGNLSDCIIDNKTVEKGNNLSDHLPLVLEVGIPIERLRCSPRKCTTGVSWSKASNVDIANYERSVTESLVEIHDYSSLYKCTDVNCSSHKNCIDCVFEYLIDICLEAGDITLPHKNDSRVKNNKSIPGWELYVKPYYDKSIF